MATYQEQKAEKRYSVCLRDGQLIGVWGNLKKLCEDMAAADPDFLTYHSLSRRRAAENPMLFSTAAGSYAVYVVTLKG